MKLGKGMKNYGKTIKKADSWHEEVAFQERIKSEWFRLGNARYKVFYSTPHKDRRANDVSKIKALQWLPIDTVL